VKITQATVALALLVFPASWNTALGQDLKTASTPASLPTAVSRPRVVFAFDRKGLPVPKYQLTINEDGSGLYEGQSVLETSDSPNSPDPPSQSFRRPLNISPTTVAQVFKLSQQLDHFNKVCASKAKNIADTGTKTLSYAGPDGSGSCTYNYTESKDVQALTDTFQGIAETMDRGRELDHLHRFDRLGLDAAIKFLADEVSEGHALEIGTIAASLRSIASDPDVMERVRTRANALLAAAEPKSH
jgi:hypothetical protein